MSIEGLDNFGSIPRPVTEYQEEMKASSKSYYERWLEDYVANNMGCNEVIEVKYDMLIQLFVAWTMKLHIKFEINAIKLGLAFKRLAKKFPNGIIKSKDHDSKYIHFNHPVLRTQLKIGICLIAPQ